jgi:MFS family permease
MSVLLLLYGGVLADRLPRRVLLVGAAGAAAVTQAAVAVLVLSGTAAIWTLALLSAVNGAVSGLGMPASLSVLPQTVPADQFTTANALTRLVSNSTNILGLSFGGALVAVAGPGWGIAVDAGTFAAAAICFSRLPIQPSQAGPRRSVVADLREGWQEFFSRTWVWAVVAQFLVLNAALAGAEGVLGPVVADRTIGRSAYGVVLASSAVGLLVGALVALKYQPRRALRFGVAVMLATALPSLSLALQPTIAALCVAFFVSGAVLDQFGVAWDTSLQQNIPPERLSRVYSYDALGSFLAIPIGQTVVGPIAAAAGVRATLIGLAAAIAVATLLALSSRSVWTLERDA